MWYNPEDVLNDLSRFTGRRMGCLDRNHVVVGHNPPPPVRHMEMDDTEFTLMFGHESKRTHGDEEIKPDLRGIQEMLKMVDEVDVSTEDLEETNIETKTTIVISKLNPLVQEFVPRNASTTLKLEDNQLNKDSHETCNGIETNVKEENLNNSHSSMKELGHNSSKESINTRNSGLSEAETKSKADELKRTIDSASNSHSYKAKREKNLAISSLLKLYTEYPSAIVPKIKLMTPSDFSTTKAVTEVSNITNLIANDCDAVVKDVSVCEETVSPKEQEPSTAKDNIEIKPENVEENNTKTLEDDPDIKKSINKVTDWLNPKPKENIAPVYLGPVLFKKKEVKSPAKTKQVSNGIPDKQYKPSKYANDLAKAYEAAKIEKQKKDFQKPTWGNLEEVLRVKDEEKRKNVSAQSSSNDSSS